MKSIFLYFLLIIITVHVLPIKGVSNCGYEKGMLEECEKKKSELDGEYCISIKQLLACFDDGANGNEAYGTISIQYLPMPISLVDSPPPNI